MLMFDLFNIHFAFLDPETTSLLPWFGDRIYQITIVLTEGKRIKSTVDLLLNPERELSLAALYINRLDESKLSATHISRARRIYPRTNPIALF